MKHRFPTISIPRQLRRLSRRDVFMLVAGTLVTLAGIKFASLLRTPDPLRPTSNDITIKWLPETVQKWKDPIRDMSKKYGIDPNLIAIIMTLESGGYSKAVSPAGAEGLMQVTPPTAKDIAAKFLKEPRSEYDLKDPITNIEFGTAYLAYLRDEFGESNQAPSWNATVELVAAGYNGGPGAAGSVYKGTGLSSTETVVYSRDAFNMWRERHAERSPTYERWLERGGSNLIDKAKSEN